MEYNNTIFIVSQMTWKFMHQWIINHFLREHVQTPVKFIWKNYPFFKVSFDSIHENGKVVQYSVYVSAVDFGKRIFYILFISGGRINLYRWHDAKTYLYSKNS